MNFRDYAFAAGIILLFAIRLALYSLKLYDLEEDTEDDVYTAWAKKEIGQDRFYAQILVFEGAAILVTWVLMLNFGNESWLIPGFTLIAGLHFFPLARVIHQNSYYFLGLWICLLAIAGYVLISWGKMKDYNANALVVYGCAPGAVVDGIAIMNKKRKELRR